MCHLMHEWNLDLIGPRATTDCVHHAAEKKQTALRLRPCWKKKTKHICRCFKHRLMPCTVWTHKNPNYVWEKCELLPVYYITFYHLREIFLIWRDKNPKTGKIIGYVVRQLDRQRGCSLNRFNLKNINNFVPLQLSNSLKQADIQT